MEIKSITHYADYRRGVGIANREYSACDSITAISDISLWDLTPRITDWYLFDEHLGDDTLVTTDYYDESGRLLVKDQVWVSELRKKKNWKEHFVFYRRRDDSNSESRGIVIKAPNPEYALETFYGVICLKKGFERCDENPLSFKLGDYQMSARVELRE